VRLNKRWAYVGVYTHELMLCAGEARIGPVPRRWWAVALPDGRLRERTTVGRGGVAVSPSAVEVAAKGAHIRLELSPSDGVETTSAAGDGHEIWTRKHALVPVRGRVEVDGEAREIADVAFVDESAGRHPRHTAWRWSAGHGTLADGRAVGWNLVDGVHDAPQGSERAMWLDGQVSELGPAVFAPDLSSVSTADGGQMQFTEWSAREENVNLLLMRSRYRQPFGTFTGVLPGGLELAEGFGVMEEHDVLW